MSSVEVSGVSEKRVAPGQGEERIHALDALRAVAMFLGIVLHAGMVYVAGMQMPGLPADVSTHWGFTVLLGFIHGFRMHVFFLLAGFFGRLVYQRMAPKDFVKQRLKRIGVPFLLGMVTVVPAVGALMMLGLIRNGGDPADLQRGGGRFDGIPTAHLWFLSYLLCLYVGALGVVAVGRRVSTGMASALDRSFVRAIRSPLRILVFVPATMAIVWKSPHWGEPPMPVYSITPEPITLAHYALFFAVGWALHRHRAELNELKRHVALSLLVGMAALVCMGILAPMQMNASLENYLTLKACAVFSSALYAWSMTFALIGLFLRCAGAARPWVRYMADASYWCYLAHLPIIIALQVWSAKWPLPAVVKFLMVLAVTMTVLLALYEWRVRYTWVGRLLNGPRTREVRDSQSSSLQAA